jgi:hypothetical protein
LPKLQDAALPADNVVLAVRYGALLAIELMVLRPQLRTKGAYGKRVLYASSVCGSQLPGERHSRALGAADARDPSGTCQQRAPRDRQRADEPALELGDAAILEERWNTDAHAGSQAH